MKTMAENIKDQKAKLAFAKTETNIKKANAKAEKQADEDAAKIAAALQSLDNEMIIIESKDITLEIDFIELEKIIFANRKVAGSNEYKLYNRMFKPYKRGNSTSNRGRDAFLWDAITKLAQEHATRIVKKVTREKVI